MLPIDTDRGCTSKSQHSTVEIYPLEARASCSPEAGLQVLGSWMGPEAQYPFLWGGGVFLENDSKVKMFFSLMGQARESPPPFMDLLSECQKKT